MKASNKLIEVFEGIGYIRMWINGSEPRYGHPETVTTQQLQEWLWKEKGLWVVACLCHAGKFMVDICKIIEDGSAVKINRIGMFDTPSEALENGLLKAVEIIKESEKR